MNVSSIDHVVFTVKNIQKAIHFYNTILGMEYKEFINPVDNVKRVSLKFGNQKINLHEEKNPFTPHAKNNVSGSMDICFISQYKIDLWKKKLENNDINIIDGPVIKSGAKGKILSIYIRDPDKNLIEIANEM